MTTTSVHRAADGYSGFAWLVAGMTAIAFIWCGLFPRLLRYGPVASHVGLMEQRQVNPAAMYYTELDRLPLRPAWVADRVTLWPAPSPMLPIKALGVSRGIGSTESRRSRPRACMKPDGTESHR